MPRSWHRTQVSQSALHILRVPLLQLETRPRAWDEWFASAGLDAPPPGGMMFEEISTIAQATAAGLGVSLLPRFLVERELASGELAVVLEMPLETSYGYYLVTPEDRTAYAPVVAFREWLLGAVKRHQKRTAA